jgi:hypothetical protein
MESEQDKRTSEILEDIINLHPTSKKVSVEDFLTRLSDRAFGIAIMIFSLVNAFIPGVSIIFSIPVFTIAGQMILGQHQIWVPKWLKSKSFRENIVDKALRKVIPTLKLLEKFIKPRMTAVTSRRGEKFIAVVIILLNLLVVLPIPGLNMIPSLCVCLLALCLLEDDGLLASLSLFGSLIVLLFYYAAFALVIIAIINGAELSMNNFGNLFGNAINTMHEKVN